MFIGLSLLFAGRTEGAAFVHETPSGIVRGESALIEVLSLDGAPIHDMKVYFRETGENDFKGVPMEREGHVYAASLETSGVTSGQIEYFIAYEGGLGSVGTMPENNPRMQPYILSVAPSGLPQETGSFDVFIVSPQPEDVVLQDEVVVVASVLGGEVDIDFSVSKLFFDEIDVSSGAVFSDGIITYVPDFVGIGRHEIKVQLFDQTGELAVERTWRFRAAQMESVEERVRMRGSLYLDNRNQRISEGNDNFFTGGGQVFLNYGNLDIQSRVVLSSEESSDAQPVNRYNGELQYRFWNTSRIYLNAGDIFPYYNPLVFQDKRIRGWQAGLDLGPFSLDYVAGRTSRGVEGRLDTDSEGQQIQVNGTYRENIVAIRPGFRFSERTRWHLNLVNSREDEGSIQYGGNVREALIVGTDFSIELDKRRILFESSFQASIQNSDAGGPEVEFQDLVELDSTLADNDVAEKAFDFLKNSGFLSVTGGLNPLPSLAMQTDLRLRYLNNNIKITYSNISSNFANPGNPYLLKDIRGITVTDHIRLLKNQVFLNVFYRQYSNNLAQEEYRTKNNEFGSSLSWFPRRSLPNLTLGYEHVSRENSVTAQDTLDQEFLYVEDNRNQRISLASSYDVQIGGLRNTLSLNFSSYRRDDDAFTENRSRFSSLTLGVRTRFKFPLTCRVSFSQSGTDLGDAEPSVTDVQRWNVRCDYRWSNLLGRDVMQPFFNLSFQNIDSEFFQADATRIVRTMLSGGFTYRNTPFGTLVLRFDSILYDEDGVSVRDHVFHARYEVNF